MIRTRIAPSPTGYFHIGTARTALFNCLFAKQHRGEVLLRFEDTDQTRSKKIYVRDILWSLKWLGLEFDGEPIYQSKRQASYERHVATLKSKGVVYEKEGAVYFKVADYGTGPAITWNDLVRGAISFALKDLEDFVIRKSDGKFLFLITNLLDDVELKVTHVIRGEDHISNTPLQIMITKALGLALPHYAHLPLILAPGRSKLSKRHGAVAVREYERMGILPEALVNYLALLGWNPGTNQEFFSLKQLIKTFDLKRVQKGGAVFDVTKLIHLNRHWLKGKSDKELVKLVKPFSKLTVGPDVFAKAVVVLRDRLGRLVEFDTLAQFLSPVSYGAKLLVFKHSTKSKTLTGLQATLAKLETKSVDLKDPNVIAPWLKKLVELNDLKNGDLFWPVRVALSGSEVSPGPHELIWVLGKDESIKRLKAAIAKLS